ncbi:ABC transporter substrate-binding protein [Yinghuangia sp. ASG 101]|uniref:ABC transporter substrate-binding protein n=1 Tax=Yinghuangia sp. ASG 101 TaxID=2896848 RepID=UPI001E4F5E7E|nr:ABC transporter substrate-binding protein [Yinghuangia sp. ASG 101]UGQ09844.1 ABC transporter substrate-binding protein [Yinghuangia sp. ASG 101]
MPALPSLDTTRRTVLRAAGAGAVLLGLAGCKSAVSENNANPAGGGDGGTPRRGGTLQIGSGIDFTPALLFTQSGFLILPRLVFNTLTAYDDNLNPQPQLAKSWQVAPDGTSVTFQLREGVKFHNGRPFTADDVVWAVENLKEAKRSAQLRATAAAVKDFTVHSPTELTLHLEHAVSNLFDLFEFMIIADRESVEEAVTGKKLIGTGPFVLKNWTPGASMSLTRNPDYFVPDRPYFDGVEIRIIPQPDSLLAALRSKQIHLATTLSGRDIAPVKSDNQFTFQQFDTGGGAIYVGANVSVKPLDDKRVRQAVSFAVNRERIVDQALGGYGFASAAPWPKSSPAYSDATAKRYTHDPDRAKALLAEAGATDLELPLAFLSNAPAIGQMVQFDLEQVGIKTTLEPMDSAQFQTRLIGQTLPALWTGQHGFAQVHPSTLAVSAYPFNEAKNSSKFSSPRYTEIVQRAWRQADPASPTAKAAYQDLSEVLLDESFVIDLVVTANLYSSTSNLRGVAQNEFAALILDDAYLA